MSKPMEELAMEVDAAATAAFRERALRMQYGGPPLDNEDRVEAIRLALLAAKREGMSEAAEIVAALYPRGSAHTYASENADRYYALEDVCEEGASAIRARMEECK